MNQLSVKGSVYCNLEDVEKLTPEMLDKKISELTVREYIVIARMIKSGKSIPLLRRNNLEDDILKEIKQTPGISAHELSYKLKIQIKKIQEKLIELEEKQIIKKERVVNIRGNSNGYRLTKEEIPWKDR